MTQPGTPVPKRHHYLAESYLERFSTKHDDRFIVFVHDRKVESNGVQGLQPLNVANQGKLYAMVGPDEAETMGLETFLSKLEGEVTTVMKDLDDGHDLTPERVAVMSQFMGTSLMRTPEAFESLQRAAERLSGKSGNAAYEDIDVVKGLLSIVTNGHLTGALLDQFAEVVVRQTGGAPAKARGPHRPAVLLSILHGGALGEALKQRSFKIVVPESLGATFVTTDAPVVVASGDAASGDSRGADPWSEQSVFYFALSARRLLVVHGFGVAPQTDTASDEQMGFINLSLAGNRHKLIIGKDEELVKSLVSHPAIRDRPHGVKLAIVQRLDDTERLPG